jgi:DNA repair photolyase
MNWVKRSIITDLGENVEAISPYIISASRSTDIPAFYSKWFFNRLNKGYIAWKNPFNQEQQFVSLLDTHFIVFWTKNPLPIVPYLQTLFDKSIGFYFQITINDYEKEGLEPNVPSLDSRINSFISLSKHIGKSRTIWRFDPLILSRNLNIDDLLEKIQRIGNKIHPFTDKLVFSFADIGCYRKVVNNLIHLETDFREFNKQEIIEFTEKLIVLNKNWGLQIATCAEEIELSEYNILRNRCIDDILIAKINNHDLTLLKWLGVDCKVNTLFGQEYLPNPKLKDKGQRKACGCIISKDIGMYNTCTHLCAYCYANSSSKLAKENSAKHNDNSHSIV